MSSTPLEKKRGNIKQGISPNSMLIHTKIQLKKEPRLFPNLSIHLETKNLIAHLRHRSRLFESQRSQIVLSRTDHPRRSTK